jgi:hypothetical protein
MLNETGYQPFKLRCKNPDCAQVMAPSLWYAVTYRQGRVYRYVTAKCPHCNQEHDKYKVNLVPCRGADSRHNFPKALNGRAHDSQAAIIWPEIWPDEELDSVDSDDSDR